MTTSPSLRTFMQTSALAIALVLTGCSGGGGSDGGGGGGGTLPPPPPPPPPPAGLFDTSDTTSHFLSKATAGPNQDQIDTLTGTDASDWVRAEFAKPPTQYLPGLLVLAQNEASIFDLSERAPSDAFWNAAIGADDQLRQRLVLALSEILVVSNGPGSGLSEAAVTIGHYMDVLSSNAFGNYRDLLQDITYSPAMAVYLTYLQNQKGDMATGSVPDENYAREILQLFSIGLIELNMDGTPRLDSSGQEIPTYDNSDITGLAKVFTGLSFQGNDFFDFYNEDDPSFLYSSLVMYDDFHSPLEKTFLGATIPPNTDGATSINTALDTIFNHSNVAPFLSRQLIQRFVTSNPEPAYIERVANTFESGSYTLPDGTSVGTGSRGDLSATIAAVLLDDNATRDPATVPASFGKIREPMLRLIHWARAFGVTSPDAADEYFLYDLSSPSLLGQHPFRSPSVFNFFRPGYVAPGSETSAAGLVAPELQIFNETSAIGNINVLDAFIFDFADNESGDPNGGLAPDYSPEIALAETPAQLIDHLDLILTSGSLQDDSRTRIIDTISEIPIVAGFENETRLQRVYLAIAMVMTTPEYVVQR